MRKYFILILITAIFLTSCNFAWRSYHAVSGIQKVTKEELKELLNDPTITILDVRDTKDWEPSDVKIPGAIRENPYDVESWAHKYRKDQKLILYCA
jgi:rhodanese-related sulfurtransferase